MKRFFFLAGCMVTLSVFLCGCVSAFSGLEPVPVAYSAQATTSDCPVHEFMDVSSYVQERGYPSPELNAYCTGEFLIVESNGIPNFEFTQITPNGLQEQDYTWRIPLNPAIFSSTSEIPLLGPVAITVKRSRIRLAATLKTVCLQGGKKCGQYEDSNGIDHNGNSFDPVDCGVVSHSLDGVRFPFGSGR